MLSVQTPKKQHNDKTSKKIQKTQTRFLSKPPSHVLWKSSHPARDIFLTTPIATETQAEFKGLVTDNREGKSMGRLTTRMDNRAWCYVFFSFSVACSYAFFVLCDALLVVGGGGGCATWRRCTRGKTCPPAGTSTCSSPWRSARH